MKSTVGPVLCAILAGATTSSGCGDFNMVPKCEEMGPGIAETMIPNALVPSGTTLDHQRVAAIVAVTGLSQVEAGYNERTCRGTIELRDGSQRVTTTIRVQQSEGAQHWQVISFPQAQEPEVNQAMLAVQAAYVRGQ